MQPEDQTIDDRGTASIRRALLSRAGSVVLLPFPGRGKFAGVRRLQ